MAIDTGALYYLVDPFVQWENVNGKPIVGGHVEVFEAGTDNKIITYADWDGTRHPFKIPLGSDGRAVILVDPGYRYDAYVYDSFNNLVCSRLNIIPLSDGDITIDGMGQVYHDETLSGKGTPNSPLTVISGGKVYGGIYPIDVNNELDMISADNVPLGVQSPLYFAQDDDEGLVIALSSVPVPEGTMNESAFGYQDGQITSYNGSAFSAGNSYEAGSYVDIDGNTINVTGLQPAGNYQSAGDYVVHDELSSYATQEWVENQSYMKEYMESAFYPSTSNPSGYLTEHQDLSDYAKTEDLTAYQEKGNYYSASNPSGFINSDAISAMATTGFVADVSGDITAMIPTDLFTKESADTLYQPIGDYQSALTFNYTNDNEISGINGSAIAGQSVTGDFELVGGTNIELVDDPVNHTTTINMTADIPSTAGLATEDWVTAQGYITNDAITGKQDITGMTAYQAAGDYLSANALDNLSGNWETVTAKQDALTFSYNDTAISAIDNSGLYDNSAHARINTLAGRISTLSSDKQDITGMTAYQPVGDYLTTADSAEFMTTAERSDYIPTGVSSEFYTTANTANYISEVPAGTMNESAFEYDENDKISGYNGSAFAGGSDVPEGVMVESSLEYNAVNEISGYNGSAIAQYGAEKQWLVHDDTLVSISNSAQYALGVNISALQRLMGIDETVLFTSSWNDKLWNVNLSEPVSSFNKIRMYVTRGDGSNEPKSYEYETSLLPTYLTLEVDTVLTNDIYKYFTLCRLSGSTYTELSARLMGYPNTLGSWNNTNSWCHPIKIVGIGRKQ